MTLHLNYPVSEHEPLSDIAEVATGKVACQQQAIFSVRFPMSDAQSRCATAELLQTVGGVFNMPLSVPVTKGSLTRQRKCLGCRTKCPSSRLRRLQPGCVPHKRKIQQKAGQSSACLRRDSLTCEYSQQEDSYYREAQACMAAHNFVRHPLSRLLVDGLQEVLRGERSETGSEQDG